MTEQQTTSDEPVLTPGQALAFLAGAGQVLSSSLDYEQTLQRVATLAVPEIADWCGLYVIGDGGDELEITSGHADAELDEVLREIRQARRERDGASESRQVAESARSVLGGDVRSFALPELDARQRELVDRLGPKSYIIVPLLARGRSLGALTLLSTREGRHYTKADLRFAEALGARSAIAIDNARLHDIAERSLSLLDTIFGTAPVGLAFVDTELRFVRVNNALAAFNDMPVEAHIGRTIVDVVGDTATQLLDLFGRVLATGVAEHDVEVSGRRAGRPDFLGHWRASYTPVRGADGTIVGVSVVVIDDTERRRRLDAERAARVRADFIARAGALLDESLDYEHTLRALAEIAVPEISDWCGVSILEPDGRLAQVAAAHIDPEQRRLGEELSRRFPPGPTDVSGAYHVATTGRTEFVPVIDDAMLVAAIDGPERLDLVRRLGLRSVIVAPLQARGRTLGTLVLANAESGRRFDEDDVRLADELARRAGVSIENARIYTERSRIAHTLQVRLLPGRLPDIPGGLLAARYRAAGELNEVGGDFYDVFPRSEREWAMVVGDVSGKGAEAAAITALARYTLRAGAIDAGDPRQALQRLNTAMLLDEDSSQFATAVLAYVSAADAGRMRVRLSLAGHLPPLVLRREGTVESVGAFGTMLGIRPDPDMTDAELVLNPGDVVLFYTDGVTEAGPRNAPFGQDGLVALLLTLAGREPQDVVDAVEQAVVDAQEGQPRDDVALLALALRDETAE